MFIISLFLLATVTAVPNVYAQVRALTIDSDQIALVKTSLGIATIIEVPDKPNSVVLGDQSAFKVEYLDKAITIKPLRNNAKTNLYVYTDWRRFNVQLVTGPQQNADYVVYLKNKATKKPKSKFKWMKFSNYLKNNPMRLEVSRVGRIGHARLIQFKVKSSEEIEFRPDWIWITQDHIVRPIQSLQLSEVTVKPGQAITGTIQLMSHDINDKQPIRIEMRRKRISYLTVPKATSWK